MNIDWSQIAPYIWFLAALVVAVVVFILIRFFWKHILKYIVHGCLVVVGIIILLVVLHYFKVF